MAELTIVDITASRFLAPPETGREPASSEERDDASERDDAEILAAARACVEAWEDANRCNLDNQRKALRFKAGGEGQWDEAVIAARSEPGKERPCLTFNEILPIVLQVTNDYLENPPGVQAHPVDNKADDKTADVITEMLRHIIYGSQGQGADTVAFESEVDIGMGFAELMPQYESDESFDQEIILAAIPDAFSVSYDAMSTAIDGSDARECVIQTWMRRDEFEREYPDAQACAVGLSERPEYTSWLTKTDVCVARYYRLEYTPDTLYGLNDGTVVWQSRYVEDEDTAKMVAQIGLSGEQRQVQRVAVKCYKCTVVDVLEEQQLPGKHIPVVPFWGNVVRVDGETKRFGMILPLCDPQQVENYAETAKAELIGQQPRAPWVGPEGFMGDVGDAIYQDWQDSNTKNIVALQYKRTGLDNLPIQASEIARQPFPAVPAALVEMRESAKEYMRTISGIGQPANLTPGSNRSGKSLREQDSQASMGNLHYMMHAQKSMLHLWKICLSWLPVYYSGARMARVMGEDGKAGTTAINQRVMQPPQPQPVSQPPGGIPSGLPLPWAQAPLPGTRGSFGTGQPQLSSTGQAIMTIQHDLTVGQYDVRMAVGPSYQTRRQEMGDQMLQLAPAFPKLLAVAGSDLIKALEWEGGDKIAQKLQMAGEPSLPGDDMDAEQMLPQVMAQAQQAQQQLQALNAHAQQLEQAAKQLTEENRELRIKQTGMQAEAAIAQKQYGLDLQDQQNTFDKALLTMQVQMLKLQEQVAQLQTKRVAQDAVHSADKALSHMELALQHNGTGEGASEESGQ